MHTLKNWRAKRAGGRITVYGKDAETGADVKVTGVDVIEPASRGFMRGKCCAATDHRGITYSLLI